MQTVSPTSVQPAPLSAKGAESAAPTEEALGSQIDELLSAMESSAAEAGAAVEGSAARSDDPGSSALEASIDEAIDQARRSLDEAPAAETVAQLDEVLAQRAEQRMSEPLVAAGPPAEVAEASGEALLEASGAPPEQVDDSIIVPVVVSAPPELPQSAQMAEAGAVTNPAPTEAAKAGAVSMLAAALSWPMRLLPPVVRDLLGWLALVTLFNAACIWIYLLI